MAVLDKIILPDGTSLDLKDNVSGYITDAGVTSFNGNTGAVTYTAPVTSVNGQTGAVTIATGGSYEQGDGIDITGNTISVESNLHVVDDTAYLQYATTPDVMFRVAQMDLGLVNVGAASYYTGAPFPIVGGILTTSMTSQEISPSGGEPIDFDEWVPVGVLGYNFPGTTYFMVSGFFLTDYQDELSIMPRIRNSNTNGYAQSRFKVQILFIRAGYFYAG